MGILLIFFDIDNANDMTKSSVWTDLNVWKFLLGHQTLTLISDISPLFLWGKFQTDGLVYLLHESKKLTRMHVCPGVSGRHLPHEQNDWQTPVKILPCRNSVADDNNLVFVKTPLFHLEQEWTRIPPPLPNFPLGCGSGPELPQFPPWVWVWTWTPSISPLDVGLDLNSLNFPLGCGSGPELPQFPPWVWAWTWSPSTSPLGVTPPDQTPPRTRSPQDQASLPPHQASPLWTDTHL